jgi:hypothetical protein
MSFQVVLQSEGGDAFLLKVPAEGPFYLYDRMAQTVAEIAEPATLAGRGMWRDFEGDTEKILTEVGALRDDLKTR